MERNKPLIFLEYNPEPNVLSTQPSTKKLVDMEKSTSRENQIIGIVGNKDRIKFAQIVPKPIRYDKLDSHIPTLKYQPPDRKKVGRDLGNFYETHHHLEYPNTESGYRMTQEKSTKNVFIDVISRDKHFYNYSNFGKIGNTDGKPGRHKLTKKDDNEVFIPPSTCLYDSTKQRVDRQHCRDVHDFSKSGRDNIKVCGELQPTAQQPEKEWHGGEKKERRIPDVELKLKNKVKGQIEFSKQLPRYNPLKEKRLQEMNRRKNKEEEDSGEESGGELGREEEIRKRRRRNRRGKKGKKKKKCLVNMKKSTGREAVLHLGMNETHTHVESDISKKNRRKTPTLNMLYSSTTRYKKKSVGNQLKTADMLIMHSNNAINELRKSFPI